MPETACLQIRARGSRTDRVVALSGEFVRIGRSPVCDVLLFDPTVARLECRLSRETGDWTLVPERSDCRVTVNGKRISGPQVLQFGQTFQVGENSLTLRSGTTALDEPEPTAEPEPEAAVEFKAIQAPVLDLPDITEEPEPELEPVTHRAEWTSRTEKHDRLLQTRTETKKWESRWKAVGERLRETSVAPAAAPRQPVGTSVEPPRTPLTRAVERPLPSVNRIKTEPREAPIRSHSVVAPRRPLRPEAPQAIPTPRATYQPPSRPAASPAFRSVSREPVARLAPAVDLPTRAELVETPALAAVVETFPPVAPETSPISSESPVTNHGTDFVIQQSIEEEEDRDNEPPIQLMLGATRRISKAPRKPRTASAEIRLDFETTLVPKVEPVASVQPIETDSTPPSVLTHFLSMDSDTAVEAVFVESPAEVVVATAPEPLVEEKPSAPTVPDSGETALHDPAVTDTFSQDVIGWHETVESPTRSHPSTKRTQSTEGLRSEGFGNDPRHGGFRRSPLDRDPILDSRRGPSVAQDWPSVSDIFAARPDRSNEPRAGASKRKPVLHKVRPEPTVAREPAQWSMPLWLGWLPASAASLMIAASLVGITWYWTVDNYHSGMVARRLDPKSGLTKPLPEGVEPGSTQWWRTSASNLLTWVQYLDRAENDPDKLAESRQLLKKASEISPLSPTVRHALAQTSTESKEAEPFALARAVGQSRDIVTLTQAGRELLRAGKPESAREAYRAALEMAAKTDLAQPISPILDGSQIRRYSLPTEDLLAPVIRDMASQKGWTFADWRSALPKKSVAPVVAARVLKELRSPDASAALDLAFEEAISKSLIADSNRAETTESAILLAAEAEALAMKDQLKEALECYHSAIERMPVDTVSRSWWLNISEIAHRLNQDSERRRALELAKSDDPKDEITQHAIELQKDAGDLVTRSTVKDKNDPDTKAASTAAP